MKLSLAVALFAGFVAASPAVHNEPHLSKRASPSEACNLGFATQNGGTKGGQGGKTVTVTNLSDFTKAVSEDGAAIVIVDGKFSNGKVNVKSNKTIVGRNGATLDNVGLILDKVKNVIIRNLIIKNVKSENGDGIQVTETSNVWIDHVDMSSSRNGGGFDGLIDITRGSNFVTVSWAYLHDHGKASLVGAGDEDTGDRGKNKVTYAYNHWKNNVSRGPLLRFGTGHVYNNYYDNQANAVNLRMGAQALVESTVFENGSKACIVSEAEVDGYAVVKDVVTNGGTINAPKGTLNSVPYSYSVVGSGNVKSTVVGKAGATLTWD